MTHLTTSKHNVFIQDTNLCFPDSLAVRQKWCNLVFSLAEIKTERDSLHRQRACGRVVSFNSFSWLPVPAVYLMISVARLCQVSPQSFVYVSVLDLSILQWHVHEKQKQNKTCPLSLPSQSIYVLAFLLCIVQDAELLRKKEKKKKKSEKRWRGNGF